MPLSHPFAYIITFDLKQPSPKYAPLLEELQKSYRWWNFMPTVWIVLNYHGLNELAEKLAPLIFNTDKLLIMPAKGPANGWLPREAWQWINEHVPKEW
jgi:hypothetical protein